MEGGREKEGERGREEILNPAWNLISYRSINPPVLMETPYRQLSWLYLCFVNSWLLLNPFNLCADWRFGAVPVINSLTDPHNLLTLATLTAVATLSYHAIFIRRRNKKRTAIGLALTVIPFIPASNLLFPVGFVVAERILYLPSMGYCVLIAHGTTKISKFFRRSKCSRVCLLVAIAVLVTLHGLRTFQRNYDWRSNFDIYSSGVKVNPGNGVMLTNLGIEFAGQKNFSNAERLYRRAIQVAPDHSKGYGNLGGLLEALGRDEEAEWVSCETLTGSGEVQL